MRLNQYLALHSDLSRRSADKAITEGRVDVNGVQAVLGDIVVEGDKVSLDGHHLTASDTKKTIILNKPEGYVVSRNGQGSKTVFDILPVEFGRLNPVGRLDKESSGLLVLTNDGELANRLTHPRYEKLKIYQVTLHKPLEPLHHQMIADHGVQLNDGLSKFALSKLFADGRTWEVRMKEGRNRQIRRTFSSLDYTVKKLHRTHFGEYALNRLKIGEYSVII